MDYGTVTSLLIMFSRGTDSLKQLSVQNILCCSGQLISAPIGSPGDGVNKTNLTTAVWNAGCCCLPPPATTSDMDCCCITWQILHSLVLISFITKPLPGTCSPCRGASVWRLVCWWPPSASTLSWERRPWLDSPEDTPSCIHSPVTKADIQS